MKLGILLINLGTPNSPSAFGVRNFLREFLTDKRVINLPVALRYALVYCLIAPFRSRRTAQAYQSIWTENGSPLLHYSEQLIQKLQVQLGSGHRVALGMRYGSPSIEKALYELRDCDSITVLPLYPQYSSAATGSSLEEVMRVLSGAEVLPSLQVIRDFYQHPAYIEAQLDLIKKHYNPDDFLLFSYHGLPEQQLLASGCKRICKDACPLPVENACYRAQCQQTTRLLAQGLGLSANQYRMAFQSRLGKLPWIQPYTDDVLNDLAAKGIKNISVACPSFVTDCLETLEEIGIRAKEHWHSLSGGKLTLIPSMNSDEAWVTALINIILGPGGS